MTKVLRLDHIGIAVEDCEASLERWMAVFGLEARGVESIEDRGVRVAHLEGSGETAVELVMPLNDESVVARFLKEKGEGLHHLCFLVTDLEGMMAALKDRGVKFVQDKPVRGAEGSRIVFIHPRSLNGVLIELKEEKGDK